MRLFYALIFLLLVTQVSFAQSAELEPASANPILRSAHAKHLIKEGISPESLEEHKQGPKVDFTKSLVPCPSEFDFVLVEANKIVFLEVDTFDLGGGDTLDLLTIVDCDQPLAFGEVIDLNGTDIIYEANNNVVDVGVDTICVNFFSSQLQKDTVLKYPVTVKRAGTSTTLPSQSIQPETTLSNFCIPQNEINLPTPMTCSSIFDFPDPNYDGEEPGSRFFIQQSFIEPWINETCFTYHSSRFPGTDRIAMVFCDELFICDTFVVPFVIPIDRIEPDGNGNLTVFDDFSYDGPYPSSDIWLDDRVYVNQTLGYEAPSIGVATFDGLDQRGQEYDIDFAGVGDRLTSKPINLSSFDEDSGFVLRYFVQRKGYGLGPSIVDSFYVEFKDDNGNWVQPNEAELGYQTAVPRDSLESFQFRIIELDDDDFFHSSFQMRFSANVSPAGVSDLWHLDYVRLDKENTFDPIYKDFAFSGPPNSLLKYYTAMPWNHFDAHVEDEIQDELRFSFFNHFFDGGNPQNLDDSNVSIEETVTGEIFPTNFTLINSFQVDPMSFKDTFDIIEEPLFSDITDFIENDVTGSNGDFRNIRMQWDLTVAAQPFEYRVNDTLVINHIFDDYFAYDDGTSEWQAFISDAVGGEQFAVRFHANEEDSLRAVQFQFPHVNGDVQNQQFRIRVWRDSLLEENLAFESALLSPFYVDQLLDTLDGFTTYRLLTESGQDTTLALEAGNDFYIGFVQVSPFSKGIPLGFDINNPHSDQRNFVNVGLANFFPFFNNLGTLMIRPIVGATTPENSTANTSDIQDISAVMKIFPNPARDKIFVNLMEGFYEDYQLNLYNNVGQLMQSQILQEEIPLLDLPSGMYFLRVDHLKSNSSFHHKLMIVD